MKTIYKTVIEPNSLSGAAYPIRIPCRKGSKPISVGKQGPHCCVWFETPTEGEVDSYFVLLCVGTGHGKVPEDTRFLGTIIDTRTNAAAQRPKDISYVWHIYVDKCNELED